MTWSAEHALHVIVFRPGLSSYINLVLKEHLEQKNAAGK